jgi:hypothetical protein
MFRYSFVLLKLRPTESLALSPPLQGEGWVGMVFDATLKLMMKKRKIVGSVCFRA